MRETLSLLNPFGAPPTINVISEETYNDLSIDYLCECLTNNEKELGAIKKIFKGITSDPEVIAYRTDVFEDFLNSPNLREKMNDSLVELAFLNESCHSTLNIEVSSIWQLIGRLSELDTYIHCVISIKECLEQCQLASKGLNDLYDFVNNIFEESGFAYLQEDIKKLIAEVSMIRSVSLGINLDARLNPKEVGIVSFNQEYFADATIMQKFIDFSKSKTELSQVAAFSGMTFIKHNRKDKHDPVMNNLTKITENMLKANVKELKTVLKKYIDVSGFALTKLIPEVMFYLKCAEMAGNLQKFGFPMVRAQLTTYNEQSFDMKDMYNIKLALHMIKTNDFASDMVMNDISFKPENRIFILTGPNRGGKTTFTQAIGLVSLLFQHGI